MYSQIILNEDGTENSMKEVSIEQLKSAIIHTDKINDYYRGRDAATWVCNNYNPEPLPGEKWRNVAACPGMAVSTMGRVKITDRAGTRIAEQVEREYPNKKLNHDILKKPKIGYLVLKDYPYLLVYRLVAQTWLQPPYPCDGWCVHHITNDGYDNRPENLIWLQNATHDLIYHGAGQNVVDYEPGKHDIK